MNCSSCDQGICNCNDHIALCIDVVTQIFKYRPEIITLYLEKVQLLGFQNILTMLPNLKYLTLKDMKYFNCAWMDDLPTSLVITSDDCISKTSLEAEGKNIYIILKL